MQTVDFRFPDRDAKAVTADHEAHLSEAERLMTVCNSCRYCEGLCAVFPAMEMRRAFSAGDLTYLSSAWDGLTKNLLSGHVSSGLRDLAQEGTKLLNRFNENIKDGLDFGDVFDIVGTLVVDLKNKFLQLDGVGSVLAGGVLAGALYKIAKLTKNGVDARYP